MKTKNIRQILMIALYALFFPCIFIELLYKKRNNLISEIKWSHQQILFIMSWCRH